MAQPVKQPVNINFAQGLNLKADPYQVPVGNFLSLVNSVFDKVGRLTKRNGFPQLTTLPDTTTSYLTTFNDDLQAIGTSLESYSPEQASWVNKGSVYPVKLSTMPIVRNSVQQTQGDSIIAPNKLRCTVYTESNGSTTTHKYVIDDSVTGQNIVAPTVLSGADSVQGTPRVFVIGNYFIVLYTKHPAAYTINYLAISWLNPASTSTAVVASSYTPASTLAFDGIVLNNNLYIAYNASSGGGINALSLSATLVLSSTFNVDPSHQGTIFTLAADTANQIIWISYWAASAGYTLAVTSNFISVLAPTQIISTGTVLNMASVAINNILTFWYELSNNYGYDSAIPTHLVDKNTCTIAGTVGSLVVSARSVGLASKAFTVNNISYYLAVYQSPDQSSYFLINGTSSTSAAPLVVAELAYSNGGGYLTTGLPTISINEAFVTIPYLRKDLLEAQAPTGAQSIGLVAPSVYTQTGVNSCTFELDTTGLASVEIGSTLNITGGFLWSYDGFLPVENNFFLWPDSVEAVGSATSGSMTAQQYYYQVTYEWTDNQGNVIKSAPSIPITVTLTSDTSIDLNIPTARLTYKVNSPIRIVIYRWSTANQTYYRVTSITSPLQNSTTVDSVTYNDGLADSSIVGNDIIYTTGGVADNISPPSTSIITLFDDRVWLVDAEDQNLLWYSKQVIESTPVEMSDLFTFYVAPSTGAQGSTGVIKSLAPMDDKLIIFKDDAIYYINGSGPDNTGANNGYSQPIFITSTVGCSNPRSIVLMQNGLMFQSNKGIWLLGRDLSTVYIGAAVEDFNQYTVNSALNIPATNQVRFGLSNGSTLMYDYFVNQWGEFQGIPSVSATLFQGLHSFVDQYGRVFQESPGTYLDGSNPVLMSLTTSWLQVGGLRGYMRAMWFYILGTYLSPHKLQIEVAYDYNSSPIQSALYTPPNSPSPYGSDPFYGGDGATPYGGVTPIEQFRLFFQRERCKAFQLTLTEVFDPSFGTVAGAGLTLSGLSCILAFKKSYAPIPSSQQIG